MRMWNVDPSKMCRKHLLGEHVELHMFLGSLRKGYSVKGYISGGLFDPSKIVARHQELVFEMEKRGYNHNSNLFSAPEIVGLPEGIVNIKENEIELHRRCSECKF
jgi:hypothetical protein